MPKQLFAKRFYQSRSNGRNLTAEQCLANFVNHHDLNPEEVTILGIDGKPCIFYWSDEELKDISFSRRG